MNIENLGELAPLIVVVLVFIWQHNIFVRPEMLEKKHREILEDVKKTFVELNAYKEFQTHVVQEFENNRADMKEIRSGVDEIKKMLQKGGRDD